MAMSVKIQATGRVWKPGTFVIPPKYQRYTSKFALYMADVMKQEVQRAIDNQRYKSKWPPLSVSYYEFKKKRNLSLNIWEATGLLKNSISVYRSGSSYVVGIPRHINYPGTLIKVYRVAMWLEYGVPDRIPPRPIFGRIAEYLRKNIRYYWEKFLREGGIK